MRFVFVSIFVIIGTCENWQDVYGDYIVVSIVSILLANSYLCIILVLYFKQYRSTMSEPLTSSVTDISDAEDDLLSLEGRVSVAF